MYLVQWHSTICRTYEPTADTKESQLPLTHTTIHNTQHTIKNRKHHHHGPPKPPASSSSNFTGECNCSTLRNQYWSPQYGDVTFMDKTNCSVILFTIILKAAAQRTHGQKVTFYKLLLVHFLRNCIKTTCTNLSYLAIFYLPIPPRVLVMFQHDFGQGGGAPLSRYFQEER
jgi:hypothetical protein